MSGTAAALGGIRVLDLSTGVAGQYCGKLLAGYGDHDHHALAGAGIADAGRHSDQLLLYGPLAPLELPVCPAAAQLPCRLGAKLRPCSNLIAASSARLAGAEPSYPDDDLQESRGWRAACGIRGW